MNYHRTTAPTLMPGVHLIVFLVFCFLKMNSDPFKLETPFLHLASPPSPGIERR